MFYVIKDNKLYEYGDNVNPAWTYPNSAKELKGVTYREFCKNHGKYRIENDFIVDISQTEEYLAAEAAKAKEIRKEEILAALDTLDMKCIRAIREGGEDEEGIPFLEKYQAKITALRQEYNSL